MKRILLGLIALAVAGAGYMFFNQPAPPTPTQSVMVAQGQVSGLYTGESRIALFSGIPYAAPPVGDWRWQPPRPASKWQGVRAATEFSPYCAQYVDGLQGFIDRIAAGVGLNWLERKVLAFALSRRTVPPRSEDCLYLNIRTGNLDKEKLQPVMVWVHGGSHRTGSGANDLYQTNALVRRDVVLVTINYRLGPFGYLAHPALSAESPQGASGNYGLLDQMAALQWVRANIEAFGGDPSNITVFGESAGSQSISEIMASPMGKGLFDKAIMESGSSSHMRRHLKQAVPGAMSSEAAGVAFLDDLVADSANASVADLRAISTSALEAQIPQKSELLNYFLPTVDGWVLPGLIGGAIVDGTISHVPVLAGYNANEGTLFYERFQSPTILQYPLPDDYQTRLGVVKEVFGEEGGSRLAEIYGLDDSASFDQGAADMLGDDLFGVHMRLMAKSTYAAGKPVWLYFFSRVPSSKNQTLGSFHASEIPFVFDSHNLLLRASKADHVLTEKLGAYWTNFAKTGNPNGTDQRNTDLPDWPAWTPQNDEWQDLAHQVAVIKGNRAEKLDLIEAGYRRKIEEARDPEGMIAAQQAAAMQPTPLSSNSPPLRSVLEGAAEPEAMRPAE